MSKVNQLILFKHFEDGQILDDMTWIMDNYDSDYYNKEDITALLYDCINGMVELAGSHGFEGNLWHNYLTYLLVNNEMRSVWPARSWAGGGKHQSGGAE